MYLQLMRVIESLGVLLACVKAVVSAQGHQLELLRQESFAGTVCKPNALAVWHGCMHACMRKGVCVPLTNSFSAPVIIVCNDQVTTLCGPPLYRQHLGCSNLGALLLEQMALNKWRISRAL